MSDTWERQKGESPQAFQAFTIYRDIGEERSIHKVAKELSKSATLIKRWSFTYNWVERSRDYDNHVDAQRRKKREKELLQMRDRHANIAQDSLAVLAKPIEAAIKKLNDDPEELKKLKEKDLVALLSFIRNSSYAIGTLTNVERIARGEAHKELEPKGEGTLKELLDAFKQSKPEDDGHSNKS